MELFNGLPLYKATVTSEDAFMYAISLVEFPATESNFLVFNEEKKALKFAVKDEDKRIVRGLVMAANLPIYRIGKGGFEYYIVYDKDTIRQMAEKYLKMGFQNSVDTEHDENYVEDIDMVQFFIKDTENGINPKGFEMYEDGSLFAEFKVNNDEIWKQIKDGTYKGFSLAGIFDVEEYESEEEQEYNDCLELIEKITKRLNRK
jgi:hypothetical protein